MKFLLHARHTWHTYTHKCMYMHVCTDRHIMHTNTSIHTYPHTHMIAVLALLILHVSILGKGRGCSGQKELSSFICKEGESTVACKKSPS